LIQVFVYADEVDRLDKAFEWVVLFLTLSYATVFQLLSWFLGQEYGTNLIWTVRAMFIPLIIIVFLWLGKFVTVEPKSMFYRKLAWSWGMFHLGLCVFVTILLVTMDTSGRGSPFEPIFPRVVLVSSVVFVPLVTYGVYRDIMKIYEKATSENIFWRSKKWNYGATVVAVLTITFFLILMFLTRPF
jgi:hypothetical protein